MPIEIDVDTTELNRFALSLQRETEALLRQAVSAGGIAAVTKAKQGGFKDRTGQLRANISSRYVGQRGNWYMVNVLASMPYASYVNDGTPPHEIWPKAAHGLKGPVRSGQTRRASGRGPHEYIVGRGMALRWVDGSGKQVFARMVKHPGTKPIPFMTNAAEFSETVMQTYISRGFAGIAARLEQ